MVGQSPRRGNGGRRRIFLFRKNRDGTLSPPHGGITPAEPECRRENQMLATCSGPTGASKSKRKNGNGGPRRPMAADSRFFTDCDAVPHMNPKMITFLKYRAVFVKLQEAEVEKTAFPPDPVVSGSGRQERISPVPRDRQRFFKSWDFFSEIGCKMLIAVIL